MLPRRVKKEKPAAAPPPVVKPTRQEPDPVEVLQNQIAEDRAKAAPGSRSGERRTIKKKAPEPAKKTYATTECGTEPDDVGVSPEPVKPMAPTAFSYFDRLTERSIFDDPLKDFPNLRGQGH